MAHLTHNIPRRTLKAHMGEGIYPMVRLPEGEPTVTLRIDGEEVTVPPGTSILAAALYNGIEIPYFCFHPGLSAVGNCRMCLVEINGRPKLEPSCIMPVAEGMEVVTNNEAVAEARRGVMEFLLLNHPLDCPWCDKAGECLLQDNAYKFGLGRTRHRMVKRTYPEKDFSDRLKMYMNRCIQCTRCVRFLQEVEGGEEFALYDRGGHVDVGTYLEHNLTNDYQGCLADVCPVGALVTKPFLHSARAFYLEAARTVCPQCATGCSLYGDRFEDRLARLRPRPNLEVNDWWMCDRGRFDLDWHTENRIETALAGRGSERHPIRMAEAFALAIPALDVARGSGGFAALTGASVPCEEIWLLRQLASELGDPLAAWYGAEGRIDPAEMIDWLQRRDRNANTRGLELVAPDAANIEDILAGVEAGTISTVLLLEADLDDETAARLGRARTVIALSSRHTPATEVATLVMPGASPFEKTGTFVNARGRLQRFDRIHDPHGEAQADAAILATFMRPRTTESLRAIVARAFADMAAQIPALSGLAFETLPANGVQIDLGPEPGTGSGEEADA